MGMMTAPQTHHCQMDINKLRPVGGVKPHPAALPDAHFIKPVPIERYNLPQFAIGNLSFAVDGHMPLRRLIDNFMNKHSAPHFGSIVADYKWHLKLWTL